MRKIYQYILMAVAMIATASCSNDLDEALQPADNGNLQFVVSDFPAFGEGAQTRAIGLQDEGKTEWNEGDEIFIHLYSNKYGDQTATLTFDETNSSWTSNGTLSYLENETPTVTAVYAPGCKIFENKIVLEDNQKYGMAEYILANTHIDGNTLQISFEGVERNYSRLRIAATADATVTVTPSDFTPAGPEGATVPTSYTLTTDAKGNAYLYGTFAANGKVEAKTTNVTKEHSFTQETEAGMSYALAVKLGDITDADDASTGDVALTDGSFVSNAKIAEMTDAQKAAMAGIVFWTVADTDPTGRTYPASLYDDGVMNADFPHCTHGLIVSLKNTETMAWQGTSTSTTENIYTTFQNTDLFNPLNIDKSEYASIECILQNNPSTLFQVLGYNHTKVLEAYNQHCRESSRETFLVRPIEALSEFAVQNPAPFGSTGWYLPSPKELHMLCYKDVDNIKEIQVVENKTAINSILNSLSSGDNFGDVAYWSSASYVQQALHVDFADSGIANSHKMIENIVRYVCAF